jgi:hypothetical protein
MKRDGMASVSRGLASCIRQIGPARFVQSIATSWPKKYDDTRLGQGGEDARSAKKKK